MDLPVLPEGVLREEGPPPPPPSDYEQGYVLPQHYEKPLQRAIPPHPNDAALQFFEEPHIYTFHGVPTTTSVTGLAHEFEKPFDPPSVIQGMKTSKGQAWPRLEYVAGARPFDEWVPTLGCLLVGGGKTLSSFPPHSFADAADRASVERALREVRLRDVEEEEELYAYERVLTDEEIADGWKKKGLLAANQGTEGHYLAELYFNGLPTRWWEDGMPNVLWFAEEWMVPRGLVSYATEKEIVCQDADVAGSIDLLLYDPQTKVHHIVDHKRSDKLAGSLRGFGKMLPPLQHLDDCKGAAYALQTSIYQYILERDYGMTIGSRVLLSIHPDVRFATSVPYLKDEVEYIMQRRFSLVEARRRVAREHGLVCSLTGAPLVDAVRVAGGELAMQKAAEVRGLEWEVDRETRARFDSLVGEVEDPPLPTCLPWWKRMPKHGAPPF